MDKAELLDGAMNGFLMLCQSMDVNVVITLSCRGHKDSDHNSQIYHCDAAASYHGDKAICVLLMAFCKRVVTETQDKSSPLVKHASQCLAQLTESYPLIHIEKELHT